MSAIMEGNPVPMSGFLSAGKPMPYDTIWSYKIESEDSCLVSMSILYNKKPYWIYHAKKDVDGATKVRAAMTAIFDLLSGLSEKLPKNEIVDLLTTVHSITWDLSGMVGVPGAVSTSST